MTHLYQNHKNQYDTVSCANEKGKKMNKLLLD